MKLSVISTSKSDGDYYTVPIYTSTNTRGALIVTVIVVGNGIKIRVQILDEGFCVSLRADFLGKARIHIVSLELCVNSWTD